jgi:hypothetical protein
MRLCGGLPALIGTTSLQHCSTEGCGRAVQPKSPGLHMRHFSTPGTAGPRNQNLPTLALCRQLKLPKQQLDCVQL